MEVVEAFALVTSHIDEVDRAVENEILRSKLSGDPTDHELRAGPSGEARAFLERPPESPRC